MELEEAIKILKYQLANRNTDIYTPINYEAIETVLKGLEKYRDLYMQSLANNLNQSLKYKEKSNEQLEALNEGWKLEVEKQEKMIELMAEYIAKIDNDTEICQYENECDENCNRCVKQYFEKKAEESE